VARTLLLADDSLAIQRVIELTFAEEDITVISVSDGDQAIARVEAHPPDIVLVDVAMPGKNGYEVASHIKRSPHLAHIPVVLLTGAFEPVDQHRAAEAGCEGVLAKPFEPQLVIGRVKALLGSPQSEPVAERRPAPVERTSPPPSVPLESDRDDMAVADSLDEFFEQVDAAMATLAASRNSEPAKSPSAQSKVSRPEVPSQTLPALAEAFTALLEADQSASPQSPQTPPNSESVSTAPAVSEDLKITDELIDRVATRVLERLSERVVRETVVDLVSSISERLVREEIERIKASIK
jgi:CheY-like chemotaxis protein